MDGRAGGLGHGPLVPNLLSVVATPETNSDVVTLGHRNGLLLERREIRMRKSREQKKKMKRRSGFSKVNETEHFILPSLTLRGKRIGNQENIPGECVSGFIPVRRHESKYLVWTFKKAQLLRGDHLLSVASLYSVVSKYPAKP